MSVTGESRAAPDSPAGAGRSEGSGRHPTCPDGSAPSDGGAAWVGGDRGSVTVEAAVVLPVLVVVLAAALAGIGCLTTQLRCVDAAREAARLAARGDLTAARSVAAELAGDATVSIEVGVDLVHVHLSTRPFGGLLPGVSIEASAVSAVEGVR